MPVMTKSGLTTSWMTTWVAPGLEMLAASWANRASRSAPLGVMATWEASGSVAQALRAFTSRPPEPMGPMQ